MTDVIEAFHHGANFFNARQGIVRGDFTLRRLSHDLVNWPVKKYNGRKEHILIFQQVKLLRASTTANFEPKISSTLT